MSARDVFAATERGDMKTLIEELNKGLDINKPGGFFESTLFFRAMFCNKLDIAELLIMRGADIDTKSGTGDTPLHLAAQFGDIPKLRLLLRNKADINVQNISDYPPYESAGLTPLFSAVLKKEIEAAKILLEHRADSTISTNNGTTPLELASRRATFMPQYVELAVLLKEAEAKDKSLKVKNKFS